jgi:hypothetical protein
MRNFYVYIIRLRVLIRVLKVLHVVELQCRDLDCLAPHTDS